MKKITGVINAKLIQQFLSNKKQIMNILIQGNTHTIISQYQIEKSLTNDFYRLVWDSFLNLSLEKMAVPALPEGYIDLKKANREIILKAFHASKANLGVTFMGIKGTGKSVDAKKISIEAQLPVLIIDKPVPRGIDLGAFLTSIEQELVVFIDEFGKNFRSYDDEDSDFHSQESLLSILDGINSEYKRLFVFTTNETLNEYMLNRPSRIKFLINYNYLTVPEIKQLLVNVLNNEAYLQDLLENLDNSNLTIDILFSIVNLINTIDKPYSEFKDIFNYVVSNTYEFVPVENGETFFASIKGMIRKGYSAYIDGYGHYTILEKNQVKIDNDLYTFRKSFSNLSIVF